MAARKTLPELPAAKGSLTAFLEAYLDYCRVRGYSERTLTGRRYELWPFCAFAQERGVLKPEEVTQAMLTRYQALLYRSKKPNGNPVSFRTQAHNLTALKMFFKWLAKERHIAHNPASELELPRVGRRLPKPPLTIAEMETLLAMPDVSTPLGLRDRTILEVFYSTAIRRGELLRLCPGHLDFGRGMVFIEQGKGKKDRFVPIGERALAWVMKYLEDGRPHLCRGREDKELFLSASGGPLREESLTHRMRQYFVASGLVKKGSCHIFRHSAATLMLEGGADIRYIQQMLGHSELSSTQIYTHVSAQKLKEVHTRTHPAKARSHVSEEITGTSLP